MRIAETAAASVIAPVPCRSSLNVRIRPRYFSRMRRPLPGPKSSHCSSAFGNSFDGRLDVGFDEGVVALAANPRVPVPRVHRIGQQALPVGADVEHHRNHAGRIDAARRGIDRQFADGDFDSTDAPVADAEDLLGVGGQDQVDIVRAGAEIPEGFLDRVGDGRWKGTHPEDGGTRGGTVPSPGPPSGR